MLLPRRNQPSAAPGRQAGPNHSIKRAPNCPTLRSRISASIVLVMLQNMMHSSCGTCQLGGKMAQMSLRASSRLSSHLGRLRSKVGRATSGCGVRAVLCDAGVCIWGHPPQVQRVSNHFQPPPSRLPATSQLRTCSG